LRDKVLSRMGEKRYLDKGGIESHATKSKDDEIDTLDTMITCLAELSEEKDAITQGEWEQKIEKNLKA
jgi:hypothetical protein